VSWSLKQRDDTGFAIASSRGNRLWRRYPLLVVVTAIVVLALLLLAIPIVTLIWTSLSGDEGLTLSNFSKVSQHPQF
jgi:peptidoglycan/LPS O-acetylase OafA/YrhL